MKNIITAAIIGSVLLGTGSVAQANALTTESLTLYVEQGIFAGTTGVGSFSYDHSLLTMTGDETLSVLNGLTLEFTIFSLTFTEENDVDYPDFPELEFIDGLPVTLNFFVDSINQQGISSLELIDITQSPSGGYEGLLDVVTVSAVPIPAAVWLFGSGLLGLSGLVRRRSL